MTERNTDSPDYHHQIIKAYLFSHKQLVIAYLMFCQGHFSMLKYYRMLMFKIDERLFFEMPADMTYSGYPQMRSQDEKTPTLFVRKEDEEL